MSDAAHDFPNGGDTPWAQPNMEPGWLLSWVSFHQGCKLFHWYDQWKNSLQRASARNTMRNESDLNLKAKFQHFTLTTHNASVPESCPHVSSFGIPWISFAAIRDLRFLRCSWSDGFARWKLGVSESYDFRSGCRHWPWCLNNTPLSELQTEM